MRDAMREMLDELEDEIKLLELHDHMHALTQILEGGTSGDRQRKVFTETGDLRAVVDSVIDETEEGLV